jgi:hypothetical protein
VTFKPEQIKEAHRWASEAMEKGCTVFHGTAKNRCWFGYTAKESPSGIDLEEAVTARTRIKKLMEK